MFFPVSTVKILIFLLVKWMEQFQKKQRIIYKNWLLHLFTFWHLFSILHFYQVNVFPHNIPIKPHQVVIYIFEKWKKIQNTNEIIVSFLFFFSQFKLFDTNTINTRFLYVSFRSWVYFVYFLFCSTQYWTKLLSSLCLLFCFD